ncbi:uncharacterized protein [Palaemon carinicauda]|uniref:uncharacterized protein n=1 Tax=Palaemon carinicauda TaxID=392227 RepID=UPI0035B6333C
MVIEVTPVGHNEEWKPRNSYLSTPFQPAPSNFALHISAPENVYAHLLISYPEVFHPELHQKPTTPAKHGIYHHIKTKGPPVFVYCRRLSTDRLAEPDYYTLPIIAAVTSYQHKVKVFSMLDLLKGHYQVPMNPEDIPNTAITTNFGTYTFNYSCFGLHHMPLVHTFTRQSDAWSAHQRQHLSSVAEDICTLQYFPGKINPIANPLPRNTLADVQLGLDYNALAEAQREDLEY